jgi:hypothetical protein
MQCLLGFLVFRELLWKSLNKKLAETQGFEPWIQANTRITV